MDFNNRVVEDLMNALWYSKPEQVVANIREAIKRISETYIEEQKTHIVMLDDFEQKLEKCVNTADEWKKLLDKIAV